MCIDMHGSTSLLYWMAVIVETVGYNTHELLLGFFSTFYCNNRNLSKWHETIITGIRKY